MPSSLEAHPHPHGPSHGGRATAGAAAPRAGWGTGPKVLAWLGAVLLVLGAAAGSAGAFGFFRLLPVGLVTEAGGPGPAAAGGGSVPGVVEVDAEAGRLLVIWEVRSAELDAVLEPEDVRVSRDGEEVRVRPAEIDGSSTEGGYAIRSVAQFAAAESGSHRIEVAAPAGADGPDGADASAGFRGFVVAEGQRLPAFVGSIFGVVALWFVAVGSGVIGLGMLVGGIVWGVDRVRRTPRGPGIY